MRAWTQAMVQVAPMARPQSYPKQLSIHLCCLESVHTSAHPALVLYHIVFHTAFGSSRRIAQRVDPRFRMILPEPVLSRALAAQGRGTLSGLTGIANLEFWHLLAPMMMHDRCVQDLT